MKKKSRIFFTFSAITIILSGILNCFAVELSILFFIIGILKIAVGVGFFVIKKMLESQDLPVDAALIKKTNIFYVSYFVAIVVIVLLGNIVTQYNF